MVAEGQAGTLALSIHVSSTFTYLERAVKALAGSPLLSPALLSNGIQDIEHADSVLDRLKLALNASVTYLMDTDGMVVASSNRNDPNNNVGKSYCFSPYFQEAAKGHPLVILRWALLPERAVSTQAARFRIVQAKSLAWSR